ncbi:hypothetical protein CERSUDRAFT_115712 [Gelatoporia subvermispora B]|uniref:ABM domain-containing protein n=1 Tax=Ceriporiopsis subvermispora (strain B) TaxID=914234 RepID=M2QUK6_CERS8|nr:hypothetical protein CERSUDRAFT_115712 [Gelatoporia subvermispora B]
MSASYAHITGEIVATGQVQAKPGMGDELANWIEKLKAYANENEPGTLEYSFARDGDTFVTWERFADLAALKLHVASQVMADLKAANVFAKPPAPLFYSGDLRSDKADQTRATL